MSNLIQIKVAELNQLNPLMIAEDNRVEQKFIQMYNAIWGTAQGAQIYEKEKFPLWMLFGYSGQRPVT